MKNLKSIYSASPQVSSVMIIIITLATVFQQNQSYATFKVATPQFQLPDSTQFQKREIIYVLNGRLLGKGQDKLKQINYKKIKKIKEVKMSTSSSEIRKYNGDPKKDIVAFYYTYESEAERKDSIDSHRRKWFGSSIK